MPPVPVTVYSPDSSLHNPLLMLRDMFRDLLAGRELAWRLAVRDINAQYRQSILGILWAFVGPVTSTATWLFLSGAGIINVGKTELPYPIYVLTGTMIWSIFTEALNAPLNQTRSASGMLAKLNFPREAVIISGIYQILFNAAIKVVLLLVSLLVVGINPGWGLLLFPLGILSLLLVGTSLGLLITPVGMLYSDVGRAVAVLLQFLMYVSPVIFPLPKSGWALTLFKLNPLTPLIATTRDWLTGFPPADLGTFLAVNGVALLLLLIAWLAYRLSMPIIIERMSA